MAYIQPTYERAESIETRKYKDHWEIDIIHGRGSNHCLVILVERKSIYVMIVKLLNKSTKYLNKKIHLTSRDPLAFKTIMQLNQGQEKGLTLKHQRRFTM